MNRREALGLFAGGGAGIAASMVGIASPIQAAQQAVRHGLPPVKVTDVKVILVQMENFTHFVIVKVSDQ